MSVSCYSDGIESSLFNLPADQVATLVARYEDGRAQDGDVASVKSTASSITVRAKNQRSGARIEKELRALAAPSAALRDATIPAPLGRKHRIVIRANATAPSTLDVEGRTLHLDGRGKAWALRSEDACVYGLSPDSEGLVRFAYYA